ncbi:hypothetical protein CLM84_11740, partial [Streptomyces albidoflavus]
MARAAPDSLRLLAAAPVAVPTRVVVAVVIADDAVHADPARSLDPYTPVTIRLAARATLANTPTLPLSTADTAVDAASAPQQLAASMP